MTAPPKLRIKNKSQADRELGLAIARLRDTQIGVFREVTWQLFMRILRETPQWSGAAVAHWTIGIDSPATFYDPSLGYQDLVGGGRVKEGGRAPSQKMSEYWRRVARDREKPKLARIRRGSTVFITNGVVGDTSNGTMSANYLEDLQNQATWMAKLREVNKPYEAAEASAFVVATQYWAKRIDPFTWATTEQFGL